MSFLNGLNGIIKLLPKTCKISIKQDECFINGVKAKSIIPRRYNIQEFMQDLIESKCTNQIHTFPISLSIIEDFFTLSGVFLKKFQKIRKLICIDDFDEDEIKENIVPQLISLLENSRNINFIELSRPRTKEDRDVIIKFTEKYTDKEIYYIH